MCRDGHQIGHRAPGAQTPRFPALEMSRAGDTIADMSPLLSPLPAAANYYCKTMIDGTAVRDNLIFIEHGNPGDKYRVHYGFVDYFMQAIKLFRHREPQDSSQGEGEKVSDVKLKGNFPNFCVNAPPGVPCGAEHRCAALIKQ